MSTPILAHEERVYLTAEATLGTPVIPASTGAMKVVSLDMGPTEQPDTRPAKDKADSRDMQVEFVAGRYPAIPFSLEKSVRSRSAVDDAPQESLLYKAAGLTETVNAATSVVYSVSSAPTLAPISVLRAFGTVAAAQYAEHGIGGLVKSLAFSGGDSELMLKAAGAFVGKRHLGSGGAATLDDASDTGASLGTVADSYRFGLGWYNIESEVVKVTAVDDATGTLTVTRGEAASVAAAHAAKPLYPYLPAFAPSGSPISEANVTITIDGVATRCTKFSIDITTGVDHLPGESGSSRIQGGKVVRIDVKPNVEFVWTDDLLVVANKAARRKEVAVSIVCGTGTGGIVTFSMPYCEFEPFAVPDPANDVAMVSTGFRVRGDSGNDCLTITLT